VGVGVGVGVKWGEVGLGEEEFYQSQLNLDFFFSRITNV
jgi:hypothetical protein